MVLIFHNNSIFEDFFRTSPQFLNLVLCFLHFDYIVFYYLFLFSFHHPAIAPLPAPHMPQSQPRIRASNLLPLPNIPGILFFYHLYGTFSGFHSLVPCLGESSETKDTVVSRHNSGRVQNVSRQRRSLQTGVSRHSGRPGRDSVRRLLSSAVRHGNNGGDQVIGVFEYI